jgi:glucosamine--fructose-6-phosphate aminotransferase (isomerizing)
VIAVAPSGPAHASVADLLPAIEERRARLLAVSDVADLLGRADTPLPLVGGVPEWLSPLVAVVHGQVTAMRLARLRGLDVDRPEGLHKVTLTR